jgi:hypothetical protein
MVWSRGTYGEKRNAYSILVLQPEGNSPHGTPKHKLDNGIKMDLKQLVPMSMDRIVLNQDRHR